MTKIVQFLVVEIIFIFIFVDKKMHYMQDVQEQKKPAILKRDHPALQYIKISKFFPFLWAIYWRLERFFYLHKKIQVVTVRYLLFLLKRIIVVFAVPIFPVFLSFIDNRNCNFIELKAKKEVIDAAYV